MSLQLLIGILLAAAGAFLIYRFAIAARTFQKFKGERLVTCPENQQTVDVSVAASKAAWEAFLGRENVRLSDCTRWPEKAGCGQDCLSQVHSDPRGCLVWNIVDRWYQGKTCAVCGKPFSHINWHDHKPAVRDAAGKTVQWSQLAAEKLPEVFQTSQPVCWNCHVAESFRRDHPDLITERPPH